MGHVSGRPFYIVENLTRQRIVARHVRCPRTSAERRRGLLGLADLDYDSGLWINPCEAVHTFGMRLRLDVIFLDVRLRVRKIVPNLGPNRVSFCLVAKSVLELREGSAAETGMACGDQFQIRSADPDYSAA